MQPVAEAFTNKNGQMIRTFAWEPERPLKGGVMIVHGIGEHAMRYQHVAEYLNQHDYAVYALDHRGHGESEGERAYIESLDDLVSDFEIFLNIIQTKDPEQKLFIFGHSMGTLVSTAFCLKHQVEVAGLISSGTPLVVDQTVSPVTVSIVRILNRYLPHLHIIPLRLNTLSRNPAVIERYKEDPLVYARPTRVRTAVAVSEMCEYLRENIMNLRLPLYIIHGSADGVAPVEGSHYLFKFAGSPDKTIEIYEGLYHELHNEPEKDRVLHDMMTWMDAH